MSASVALVILIILFLINLLFLKGFWDKAQFFNVLHLFISFGCAKTATRLGNYLVDDQILGCLDYIKKPFDNEDLIKRVKEMVG